MGPTLLLLLYSWRGVVCIQNANQPTVAKIVPN